MKTIKAQRSRVAAVGTGTGTGTTHGSGSVGYMARRRGPVPSLQPTL
jgi:hypothetical protein